MRIHYTMQQLMHSARRKSTERCGWRWKVMKSEWDGFKACENNFLNICFRFVECIWYMAYMMIVIWYIWFVCLGYLIHLNFSNYKTFSLHFRDICFGYLLLMHCYNYLIILLCFYFITIFFYNRYSYGESFTSLKQFKFIIIK